MLAKFSFLAIPFLAIPFLAIPFLAIPFLAIPFLAIPFLVIPGVIKIKTTTNATLLNPMGYSCSSHRSWGGSGWGQPYLFTSVYGDQSPPWWIVICHGVIGSTSDLQAGDLRFKSQRPHSFTTRLGWTTSMEGICVTCRYWAELHPLFLSHQILDNVNKWDVRVASVFPQYSLSIPSVFPQYSRSAWSR